ncbi:sodium/proline symporter PutP [Sphingobacterium sp. DK4209]|uniref:Sodium/proline symporter n=1 Tax=Sphingobacterium zhuxiongii TaxID=2662364 RepID=A0A5Q0QED2_9SPHI|nr:MULTISPECIES: sodium/proline symporter PutP [unclassified Sphingobacterium]MVZ66877.1 sodium/proline symporter PutP [Sphingobacterium sp. DK4209]QGA25520.1 sodium/proline symporter PutP [Sphingobacterium sp. dk4302]
MNIYELISIGLYMLLMILIGLYSYKKSTSNSDDFLIGGRKMGAAVTALSAGAADMSGWLLMGLPGAMYLTGLSASWIAIGLTIGAFLNYVIVAPRLRVYTEVAKNSITLPVFFENRFHDKTQLLKITSSVLILVFFTLYTSAGMVSGGRLFESAFQMDYYTGLFVTSSVVVLYTFLGGFLAVSLTDFVQGTIMVLALVILPTVIVYQIGGMSETLEIIETKNANYLDLFKGTTTISILSLVAWGLGYFGQPHILVRFMAIEHVSDIPKARNIGISWMIFTVGGAMLVGLFGIAYLIKYDPVEMQRFDGSKEVAETIFIHLSRTLFHPLVGGFLLSAILAAVMSTISSQLLVTSSSMTEDIYKTFFNKEASPKRMLLVSRLSVLIVAIIALLLSLSPKDSILNLVGNAWAGFGAAFGPLIILSLLWKRTTAMGGLFGMLVGGAVVLAWVYIPHNYKEVYEMIPGFISSFLTIVIVSLLTKPVSKEIEMEFDEVDRIVKQS